MGAGVRADPAAGWSGEYSKRGTESKKMRGKRSGEALVPIVTDLLRIKGEMALGLEQGRGITGEIGKKTKNRRSKKNRIAIPFSFHNHQGQPMAVIYTGLQGLRPTNGPQPEITAQWLTESS